MDRIVDCTDPSGLLAGVRQARQTLGRGGLAVIPTDTVYGIAADAFNPEAVAALLAAKGRGRQQPPPVLISGLAGLSALADPVPDALREALAELWPGGLTVVLSAMPSLAWDLGETRGTVALRVPDHTLTRELLAETGPLAVSSANRTGNPAARTAVEAYQELGDRVDVYLDAGPTGNLPASTIIDAVDWVSDRGPLRMLRDGAVSIERLREVFGADAVADPAP